MRVKTLCLLAFLAPFCSSAITIAIDYRYDDNDFFAGADAQQALQRAADRWSRVLADGQLSAASIDDGNDRRIGFRHPATGVSWQVSGAASSASDALAGSGVASEYRAINFDSDTWTLYAGGRDLGFPGGQGGTGTGLNFSSTFNDPTSHLNRGFNLGSSSVPVWGGSIAFDTETAWDFTTDATGSGFDFYSIALHEIGHALGLSLGFSDFTDHVSGSTFIGPEALAAFNADNGTTATSLNLERQLSLGGRQL